LLDGLQELAKVDGWPERVLSMQQHWIGKSKGAKIRFPLTKSDEETGLPLPEETIDVFTTRPDTLFGAQYLALSISHPIVQQIAHSSASLQQFIEGASRLPPESKSGYLLTGKQGANPLSKLDGMPEVVRRPLPIYVAPYVLSEYGEGAVMGVPGHDARDFEFWREQKGKEEILTAIAPPGVKAEGEGNITKPFVHEGILTTVCGPFSGFTSSEATEKIVSRLSENELGSLSHSWRLRDWLISRQRYWGTPIPIIHCQECGAVPVLMDKLPVELPKLPKDPSLKGNPLESAHEWVNTTCPKCSRPAKRDTDTMDTFVDSSWYYMRFPDSENALLPFSPESAGDFLPVDTYIGGVEHAILHLLYARFIHKFLSRSPLFPSAQGLNEPFHTLITQGMVHGKTYSEPKTGRFIRPSDLDLSNPSSPRIVSTGETPNISYEKMSKSKHNGVDPTQTIQKYGADATRAHILFAAPVSEILDWDEEKIVGIQRWFNRLWRVVEDVASAFPENFSPNDYLGGPGSADPLSGFDSASLTSSHISLLEATNSTISSLTTTFDSNPYALNTAVSDLTKLSNAYSSHLSPSSGRDSPPFPPRLSYLLLSAHLRLLAPIAPAFADECWERLHSPATVESIHTQAFPTLIPIPATATQVNRTQTVAIQINGKLRFTMELPTSLPAIGIAEEQLRKKWVLEKVGQSEEGKKWLRDEEGVLRKQKRAVVVGDGAEGVKLVNIVLDNSK
jgi:leucyl-tRNA synthetase